jgi:hypothetical protein
MAALAAMAAKLLGGSSEVGEGPRRPGSKAESKFQGRCCVREHARASCLFRSGDGRPRRAVEGLTRARGRTQAGALGPWPVGVAFSWRLRHRRTRVTGVRPGGLRMRRSGHRGKRFLVFLILDGCAHRPRQRSDSDVYVKIGFQFHE